MPAGGRAAEEIPPGPGPRPGRSRSPAPPDRPGSRGGRRGGLRPWRRGGGRVSAKPRLRGRAARLARLIPTGGAASAARTPFVLLVVVLLGGGLIVLLVLNSALSEGAFKLDDLQRQTKNLTDEEQASSGTWTPTRHPTRSSAAPTSSAWSPAATRLPEPRRRRQGRPLGRGRAVRGEPRGRAPAHGDRLRPEQGAVAVVDPACGDGLRAPAHHGPGRPLRSARVLHCPRTPSKTPGR